DAAATIQAFATRLRQQLDLDALTAELLAVVDQTMEPTRTSLWLWLRPAPQPSPDPQGRDPDVLPDTSGLARPARRQLGTAPSPRAPGPPSIAPGPGAP